MYPSPGPTRSPLELTPRQNEVAELVAGGLTNREIGDALTISPATVKRHVSDIIQSLDEQIWAGRFDGARADVFEIQDAMTLGVLSTLEPEIRERELARATRKPASELGAWECLQHAQMGIGLGRLDDAQEAVHRAIQLDPGFAHAHALRGMILVYKIMIGLEAAPESAIDDAIHSCRHAVELDSLEPMAWHYLCAAYAHSGRLDEALTCAKKGIELNPSGPWNRWGHGEVLGLMGRGRAALVPLRHATRLSPRDQATPQFLVAFARAHFVLEDHDECVAAAERSIALQPYGNRAWPFLIAAHALAGRKAAADAALSRARERRAHVDVGHQRDVLERMGAHESLLARLIEGLELAIP